MHRARMHRAAIGQFLIQPLTKFFNACEFFGA